MPMTDGFDIGTVSWHDEVKFNIERAVYKSSLKWLSLWRGRGLLLSSWVWGSRLGDALNSFESHVSPGLLEDLRMHFMCIFLHSP